MADQRRVVKGEQVERFPRRRHAPAWDFSAVADGNVYRLRKGHDFDVEVETVRGALKRWARERGLEVATLTEFDGAPGKNRRKVGLYVQFSESKQARSARAQ
jgi:hypothetical protein